MTAKNWVFFSVGRVLAYLAVGIVENAVPSYTSELAPAALRGFLSGSLVLVVTLGNLWGTVVVRAYAKTTSRDGWLVPTAMQVTPPVTLLVLLPFTPGWYFLLSSKASAHISLRITEMVCREREVRKGHSGPESRSHKARSQLGDASR